VLQEAAGFPSEQCRGLYWYVHNAAHWQTGAGYGCDRKHFFAHQFMFMVHGRGTGTYRGKPFSAGPGTCVVMDLAQPHSYWSDTKDPWEMYWVRFDGPGVPNLVEALVRSAGSPAIPYASGERVRSDFAAIFSLLKEQPPGYDAWVWQRLVSLSANVIEGLRRAGVEADPEFERAPGGIAGALHHLRNQHRQPIALQDLARVAHMSPFHFVRKFKEATSFTPMEYLEKFRISRAQEIMLAEPNRVLKDVAAAVGFADPAYFSRVFRKRTGLSPRTFRDRLSPEAGPK